MKTYEVTIERKKGYFETELPPVSQEPCEKDLCEDYVQINVDSDDPAIVAKTIISRVGEFIKENNYSDVTVVGVNEIPYDRNAQDAIREAFACSGMAAAVRRQVKKDRMPYLAKPVDPDLAGKVKASFVQANTAKWVVTRTYSFDSDCRAVEFDNEDAAVQYLRKWYNRDINEERKQPDAELSENDCELSDFYACIVWRKDEFSETELCEYNVIKISAPETDL